MTDSADRAGSPVPPAGATPPATPASSANTPPTTAPDAPRRLSRIVGLDAARALALFGMFAAHVGHAGDDSPGGWRWLVVTQGRASALFAVLAGVSISLMLTRRAGDGSAASTAAAMQDEERWMTVVRHTRVRVAVRAVLLIGLGFLLAALATPVDVILDNLGVMFLLALIAMRWNPWAQLGVGVTVLIVGREALSPLITAMPEWLYTLPVVHELWSFHYPALVWVGYVLVGMSVGRLAPWRGRPLAALAGAGAALALIGYGGGAVAATVQARPLMWVLDPEAPPAGWFELVPHSYSPAEMLGNLGTGFFVIAACCAVAAWVPRVVGPLADAGAMTLTLYSAHIVLLAVVGPEMVWEPSNVALVTLCVACIAFAFVWRRAVGQGPLERLLTATSERAADIDALRRQLTRQ